MATPQWRLNDGPTLRCVSVILLLIAVPSPSRVGTLVVSFIRGSSPCGCQYAFKIRANFDELRWAVYIRGYVTNVRPYHSVGMDSPIGSSKVLRDCHDSVNLILINSGHSFKFYSLQSYQSFCLATTICMNISSLLLALLFPSPIHFFRGGGMSFGKLFKKCVLI